MGRESGNWKVLVSPSHWATLEIVPEKDHDGDAEDKDREDDDREDAEDKDKDQDSEDKDS